MIIKDGNLCEDSGYPLSCPLQPVVTTMAPGVGLAGQKKMQFIRQGCVINCTHFVLDKKENGSADVELLCCGRRFYSVKIKSGEN